MLATESPFPQYFDIDGTPLNSGSLFFGVANQNPETNPITVYWDAAGTQPAAQPIPTINGYAVRSGTPALLFANSDYSVTVRNLRGNIVFTAANSVEFSNSSSVQTSLNTFISNLAASSGSSLVGFIQGGAGAVARTAQSKLRESVSVLDFGAIGNGIADDVSAINSAISYVNGLGGGDVYFPKGTYRVKSSIQYLAGVNLVGESMLNCTLRWHPDANTAGSIVTTSNQNINRVLFKNLRFAKDAGITANTTGILGGSTLANYNSAIACFENLHFDGLTYGIRGNAEPTGVGIFDCYFKNIWCSGCFFGLWLFGSSNRVDHPRMTTCDTAIALDFLNSESFDGMTVTGGTFVQNSYDVGVLSASGIRPTKFIGSWHEQSVNGIINIQNANSRVMNLDFIGSMLSTFSVASLFNVTNAIGTISVDRCTLISGGVGKAQNFVRPSSAEGRLIVVDCQKYDSSAVASFESDYSYFEAVKSAVDQSINSGVATKITWAAASIDSANGFDNANDRYVIPAPGIYRVSTCASFAAQGSSTSQNKVAVYKNGSLHRTTLGASNTGTITTERVECLVSCNAGDYLEVFATQNSGVAVNIHGANDLTYFAVEFVRTR